MEASTFERTKSFLQRSVSVAAPKVAIKIRILARRLFAAHHSVIAKTLFARIVEIIAELRNAGKTWVFLRGPLNRLPRFVDLTYQRRVAQPGANGVMGSINGITAPEGTRSISGARATRAATELREKSRRLVDEPLSASPMASRLNSRPGGCHLGLLARTVLTDAVQIMTQYCPDNATRASVSSVEGIVKVRL